MKIGAIPESALEWLALKLELAPRALIDTHAAMLLARTVMAGAELGVFDVLVAGPLTPEEAAQACSAATAPMALLLDALAASGYLRLSDGRFELARRSRRWLVGSVGRALRDKLMLQVIEWRWLETLHRLAAVGVVQPEVASAIEERLKSAAASK